MRKSDDRSGNDHRAVNDSSLCAVAAVDRPPLPVCYSTAFQMATVRFTRNIQRHVACPTCEVHGATLREVLDAYFHENDRARGYVLDEQGRVRQHMVVFIDGELVRDRDQLSDPVEPNSFIDVI